MSKKTNSFFGEEMINVDQELQVGEIVIADNQKVELKRENISKSKKTSEKEDKEIKVEKEGSKAEKEDKEIKDEHKIGSKPIDKIVKKARKSNYISVDLKGENYDYVAYISNMMEINMTDFMNYLVEVYKEENKEFYKSFLDYEKAKALFSFKK